MKQLLFTSWVLLSVMVSVSCEKQRDYTVNFTSNVTSSDPLNCRIFASFDPAGTFDVQGLVFSVDSNVAIDSYNYSYNNEVNVEGKIIDETNSATKTFRLEKLASGTTYYFKLFTVFNGLLKYSDLKSFATDCSGLGCGPAGGQIIYINPSDSSHGIEVANYPTVRNSWGCSNIFVGGTSSSFGSGQANSTLIVNNCGNSSLAKDCEVYYQNGYSDYYMPSTEELELIYSAVYQGSNNPNYWGSFVYYSSTEADNISCWAMNFDTGITTTFSKVNSTYSTIPIRKF